MLTNILTKQCERSRDWRAGRLDAQQAAALLGFQEHDITVLIRARLLKPLGRPTSSARKYFARVTLESLAANPEWLDKATQVVSGTWRERNERKKAKWANDGESENSGINGEPEA